MTPPMGGAAPWTRGTPPGVAGAAVNGTAGPAHAGRDDTPSAAVRPGAVSPVRVVRPSPSGRRG